MNFLIPVHNEALLLPRLIRKIFSLYPHAQVCLVDSMCRDESMELAQGYRVLICKAPQLGYAHALGAGYRFIDVQGWDHVIQLDADGQHDPIYALGLYRALAKGDWVIGSRHQTGSYASAFTRMGSRLGRFFLRELSLHDPSSGYWALNRKSIAWFAQMFPVDFTEVPLRLQAHNEGLRIVECSIPMDIRREGLSMHAGWRGWKHAFFMFAETRKKKKKSFFSSPKPRND